MKKRSALEDLLRVMAILRSPSGCPWDREQTHMTLRFHAVEEVYELMDAIEAGDDQEMIEELGYLLLQVVFHCQLARERRAFDLERVARVVTDKLIRRHPHVFGNAKVKDVAGVWAQWDQIKKAEKAGTKHERPSVFDGIPKHLPALLRVEKLVKKARKAGAVLEGASKRAGQLNRSGLAKELFRLAAEAQQRGWSAEALVRSEANRNEKAWRQQERNSQPAAPITTRPKRSRRV